MKLILIRGLPGSGKTTLAELLIANYRSRGENICHMEADKFYMVGPERNEYKFDGSKIKYAHGWCRNVAARSLMQGCDVIVSNTFTTLQEMYDYVIMARDFGAKLEIHECYGEYQNIHGVPEEVLVKMKQRWHTLTPMEMGIMEENDPIQVFELFGLNSNIKKT